MAARRPSASASRQTRRDTRPQILEKRSALKNVVPAGDAGTKSRSFMTLLLDRGLSAPAGAASQESDIGVELEAARLHCFLRRKAWPDAHGSVGAPGSVREPDRLVWGRLRLDARALQAGTSGDPAGGGVGDPAWRCAAAGGKLCRSSEPGPVAISFRCTDGGEWCMNIGADRLLPPEV